MRASMEEMMEKINDIVVKGLGGRESVSAFCVLAKRQASDVLIDHCVMFGDTDVMLNSIITETSRVISGMCKTEASLKLTLDLFTNGVYAAAAQLFREWRNVPDEPTRFRDPEQELADRIARSRKEGTENGTEHKD